MIALAFCPQTIEYQRVLAEAAGYKFDAILCDDGVSTRLAKRPEGRRLFDMLREGDTLLVRQARA